MQLMMSNVELASDSIVDRVYEQLKAMAVSYEFKPGERLNEGELAKRLGVSRTPLREALNRLNTEGFLRFTPGKGFFCRRACCRCIRPCSSRAASGKTRAPVGRQEAQYIFH